jgi:hypothetical protein
MCVRGFGYHKRHKLAINRSNATNSIAAVGHYALGPCSLQPPQASSQMKTWSFGHYHCVDHVMIVVYLNDWFNRLNCAQTMGTLLSASIRKKTDGRALPLIRHSTIQPVRRTRRRVKVSNSER